MRILDLFCKAGGAARGYADAGFEVVGVDIEPQPNYPYEFHQADAMTYPLGGFDALHASPPCQDHMLSSPGTHGTGWMLDATRQRFLAQETPWVIENVPGAAMRADFRICGCQVGLEVRRERLFETSWGRAPIFGLPPHYHPHPVVSVVGSGTPTWVRETWSKRMGHDPTINDLREAMGIDWMTRAELSQAIPPAYTEFIGRQLLEHLNSVAV